MAAQAVAFKVPEDDYPGPDLNGDGDYSDLVAFTYHFPSATLFASGLAVDSIDGTQATFLCNVSEQKQGHTDLNGDGDPDDHVGHVLDALQGRSANLGLSASAIDVAGDFAIFNVYEFGQGAVDLNGDGDVLDSVLHLHVIPTQDSWDSGVSCDQQIFKSKVVGSSAVWLADEADEGFTDLNGDGDQGDLVLHALRPGGSTPLNLGLAAHSIYPPHPAKAAFVSADEADQHQDLNGDGDQVDLVAHLLLP